jgi:hypothetical protein
MGAAEEKNAAAPWLLQAAGRAAPRRTKSCCVSSSPAALGLGDDGGKRDYREHHDGRPGAKDKVRSHHHFVLAHPVTSAISAITATIAVPRPNEIRMSVIILA